MTGADVAESSVQVDGQWVPFAEVRKLSLVVGRG
jgi:hypothetical protein